MTVSDPTLSPNLGIQLMAENVLEKEIIFNEAVLTLDALFKGTILDTINAPPSTVPSPGSAYLIGTSPTGAFVGQANSIVFYYNGYQFITPPKFYRVFDVASGSFLDFDGNVWTPVPAATVTHLTDLLDVSAGGPSDGAVLAFDAKTSKWIAGVVKFPVQTFAGLSDVSVANGAKGQVVTLGSDGKTFTLSNLPSAQPGVTALAGLSDYDGSKAVDSSDGFVAIWSKALEKLTFQDPKTIITTGSLDQVGDVAYGSKPQVNDQLVWNGASWGPSSRNTVFSFIGMQDGPKSFTGNAGKFMVVDPTEDALVFTDVNTLLKGSAIKLQGLGDVPASIGTAGQALVVNPAGNGFIYTNVAGYIRVQHAESDVDTMVKAISFDGNVMVTDGASGLVVVSFPTPPAPYAFSASGQALASPTGIDFTGPGVSVAEVNGLLEVTVTGGALANLSDVNVPSPSDGNGLVYDGPSKKWVPRSISAQLMNVSGVASPNTYEFGPFAPPGVSLFPIVKNGQDATVMSIANRGFSLIPSSQAGTTSLLHTIASSQPPFSVTCRVAVNPGDNSVFAGVTLARNSTSKECRLGQNDGVVIFDYQNEDGSSNSTVTSANKDWKWLRLSYDGTNVIAFYGKDGITWTKLGQVGAAAALTATPDQSGIFVSASTADGTGGALFTFYDDMDYPATARTTYGYLQGSISACGDVDLSTAPTDGQALVWNASTNKFKPGSVAAGASSSGSSTLAGLTDVDESTPPTDGQALVYSGTAKKWHPGTVAAASSGAASPASSPAISNLADVDETNAPTSNQALVYDSTAKKWKPGTLTGVTVSTGAVLKAASFTDYSSYARGATSAVPTLVDGTAPAFTMTAPSGGEHGVHTALRPLGAAAGGFEFIANITYTAGNGVHYGIDGLVLADATNSFQIWGENGGNSGREGNGCASYVSGGNWNDADYNVGSSSDGTWFRMLLSADGTNLSLYRSTDPTNWGMPKETYTLSNRGIGAITRYGFAVHNYDGSAFDTLNIAQAYSTEVPKAATSTATTYKGVRIRAVVGGGNTFGVGQIIFQDANGKVIPTTGGQSFASSTYSGSTYTSDQPFAGSAPNGNGDSSQPGSGWYAASGQFVGEYIGYTFATAQAVATVTILPAGDSTGVKDAPLLFEIDVSSDGTSYLGHKVHAGTKWALGAGQTFKL